MKEKIRNFIVNKNKKVLFLKRNKEVDAVSEWKRFGGIFRTPTNFIILSIFKFCPSMKLKRFALRNFLGITIGKKVGIAPCVFDCVLPSLISIGDNSIIGNKAHLMCHEFTNKGIRIGRVNIGKNVLVGAYSKIRSGVTIGDNSEVCMDSFVNKDVPANELWGGIPAKRIKKLKK